MDVGEARLTRTCSEWIPTTGAACGSLRWLPIHWLPPERANGFLPQEQHAEAGAGYQLIGFAVPWVNWFLRKG